MSDRLDLDHDDLRRDGLHEDYVGGELDEGAVDPDPVRQFQRWFDAAKAADEADPPAMTLATATPDGWPSARMVYLRQADARGFVFFTNYESRKGAELAGNPRAALVFFWPLRHRQVRIEGRVERCEGAESDDYFAARPRGSQLGAWASPQSQVLPDRAALARRVDEIAQRFPGPIPRPPFWGGCRVVPDLVEFWQGRESRLHDRLRYTLEPAAADSGATGVGATPRWKIERLAP